jgi:hypothetical protein
MPFSMQHISPHCSPCLPSRSPAPRHSISARTSRLVNTAPNLTYVGAPVSNSISNRPSIADGLKWKVTRPIAVWTSGLRAFIYGTGSNQSRSPILPGEGWPRGTPHPLKTVCASFASDLRMIRCELHRESGRECAVVGSCTAVAYDRKWEDHLEPGLFRC